MKRIALFLAAAVVAASTFAADGARVGAWNLRWFPAGFPVTNETEKSAQYEQYRINTAARFIARHNVDILMLEEMRSREICERLVSHEALKGFSVSACTAFPTTPDAPVPAHQNAIISKLKPVDSGWREWKWEDGKKPPRGFVWAVFDIDSNLTAVAGVHLKSNFIPDNAPDKDKVPLVNRALREISARQLVAFAGEIMAKDYAGRKVSRVIFGGDFNTSVFDDGYKGEKTIPTVLDAGFRDCFKGVVERNTMPATKYYPASCFDYIFLKGNAEIIAPEVAPPAQFKDKNFSDHQLISVLVK